MASLRRRVSTGCLITLSLALLSGEALRAQQSTPAWKHYPSPPRAPKGAPNILLVMTDDVGFSATTAFGGPIPTPTFDALAQAGLRYSQFHTTAMCSPSRAALLTGRNHHAVGAGAITDLSTDAPGYTSVIPDSAATVGRVLRDNGYDTSWFGKSHNVPEWELGPMGPFNHWPNAWGFEYFYGFHASSADQFAPLLVENRNPVDPPTKDPDYTLDRDLSDHLIQWLRIQRNQHPDRPFFAYLAPGTVHSPHQAPADWIARFKGKFDQGWDKQREATFKRQQALGVIPANAQLTPRPKEIPAWDSLSPAMRKALAHQMEVAAAQLAHSDAQIGRVIEELRANGQLDNTLVVFIQGDNGGSFESHLGTPNEAMALKGVEPSEAELTGDPRAHGGPQTFSNYAAGWAWATNTPFQWGKQMASHLGGLRDGLVISWPRRIAGRGQWRQQFHHLIDVAPTLYEAAGIAPPKLVDGVAQQPIDGVSMVYSFDAPAAPSPRRRQYFEMLGNRSIYLDGWFANTVPIWPQWDRTHNPDPLTYQWELYDLGSDYSQAHDLAAANPVKLAELQRAFAEEAARYHIEPIANNVMGRFQPENRPLMLEKRDRYTYYPSETRYAPGAFPAFDRDNSLVASVGINAAGASGTILAQGDMVGGVGLPLNRGRARLVYNPMGRPAELVVLESGQALTRGEHVISVKVTSAPDKGARAAMITLEVDGRTVKSANIGTFYPIRDEAYVGRPNVRQMLAGEAEARPAGFTLKSLVRERIVARR